jgi:hypothetical protein
MENTLIILLCIWWYLIGSVGSLCIVKLRYGGVSFRDIIFYCTTGGIFGVVFFVLELGQFLERLLKKYIDLDKEVF